MLRNCLIPVSDNVPASNDSDAYAPDFKEERSSEELAQIFKALCKPATDLVECPEGF